MNDLVIIANKRNLKRLNRADLEKLLNAKHHKTNEETLSSEFKELVKEELERREKEEK